MDQPQNLTTCSNCLHKTSGDAHKLVCLVTGKTVGTDDSCESFSPGKRNSQEIAQFGFEAEKEYFSTKLYNLFAAYLIGIVLGSVFLYIGYSDPREHVVMIIVSVLVILVSAVFSVVLLYNLWKFTISELKKHGLKPSIETPGKAVGYLFIPFFNFYWVFMAMGKLPVDLNRIATARAGKTVMANELGIIISVATILSVIPVVGMVLALINMVLTPVFFILAINGVRNIPYSPGVEYVEKRDEAEPLDINTVRDYSQLFDKKKYGINLWFGLYYFVASVCSQITINVTYFIMNKISVLDYFSTSNILNLILYPLLFSLVIVILSHAIRQKVLLALLWGLTSVVVGAIPFLLLMMRDYDYYNQYFFSKGYLVQIITNFLSAVLFIGSISIFIRLYGLKLWSILLSIAIPSIITNSVFYIAGYLLEGKFNFNILTLVGFVVHLLFFSIAIYFAFYQYVQRTNRAVPEG